jgi:outer membrane protein OmpA-like peptidoglycan-associated protein
MKGCKYLIQKLLLFCLLSIRLSGQYMPSISTRTPVFSSTYSEYAPLITPAGDAIFFSRGGHSANFGFDDLSDIWESDLNYNGQWRNALNLGPPINDESENQIFSVSLDGNRLFLSQKNQQGKTEIVLTERNGRSWTYPQAMSIENLDSLAEIRHAFVSIDENWLFACIYHPDDGWGKTDIYVAQRKDHLNWGTLKNLGPLINSEGDESTVFFAPDGNTLYFSSNGRKDGLGGQDIFMSRRSDDSWEKWSPPTNLASGINSPADEEFFSTDVAGEIGIFSVQEKKGSSVIFQNAIPELLRPRPVILLEGTVREKNTHLPMAAQLHFYNLDTNGEEIKESILPVGRDGKYKMVFSPSVAVGLYATQDSFFSASYTFNPGNIVLETEDRTSEELKELQEKDPNYQIREKEIESLQVYLDGLDKDIDLFGKDFESSLATIQNKKNQIIANQNKEDVTQDFDQEILGLKKQYDATFAQEALEFHGSTKTPLSSKDVEEADFKGFYKKIKNQIRLELLTPTLLRFSKELRPEAFRSFKEKQFTAKELSTLNPWLIKALNELEEHPLNASTEIFMDRFVRPKYQDWEEPFASKLNNLIKSKVEKELIKTFRASMDTYLKKQIELDYKKIERVFAGNNLQGKLEEQKNIEKQLRRIVSNGVTSNQKADQDTLFVVGKNDQVLDIELSSLSRRGPILMENIFFEANTAILDTNSFHELDRLIVYLNANPRIGVEVNVYTHNNLTYEFASAITSERGQVLAEQLINRGLDPLRVHYRGLGKTNQLDKNDTVQARCKNQRVEVMFFDLKDN